MSDLADQLKALGLKQSAERQVPAIKHVRTRSDHRSPSREPLHFLQLAQFGTVAKLDEERGFGFIAIGGGEVVFFHFRGFPGRLPRGQKLPPVGMPLLFITGSDPRHPLEPKKGAVLWAPVETIPWSRGNATTDQTSLDTLRRGLLAEQPLEALLGLLDASWYTQRWSGNATAPTDLEDVVLEQVVGEKLAEIPPTDLKNHQVGSRLAKSRYRFSSRLSPDNPACSFARLLELLEPLQLAALGAPDARWIREKKLTLSAHSKLLEWHLLSLTASEQTGDWQRWFPGDEVFEVNLANRFLAYGISPDGFTSAWLARVARTGQLSTADVEKWAEQSPELAVVLFEQLSPGRQASLLSTWRSDPASLELRLGQDLSRAASLLAGASLAFDLETDGERIWEIGCARNGQAVLLHDDRTGTNLEAGLADLCERIHQAPLLVGHNILAWDWPIVARNIKAETVPLMWDTLLVQYLLEPQAPSHALGGSHHADDDALATAQLFEKQLASLPKDIARRVLCGEFADFEQLLDAIIEALKDSANFSRAAPELLDASGSPPTRLVVAPESRLRALDWVPHTSVVAADPSESLEAAWREIDADELEKRVLEGAAPGPAARIMVAVARMAAMQGIALRRNMIPAWLLERDVHLASAVDAACRMPAPREGWRFASIPTSINWWTATDTASYAIVGLSHDVLVLDHRQVSREDITQEVSSLPVTPFMRIKDGGSVMRWLLVDRAAHVLEPRGGLSAFRTLPISGATLVHHGNRRAVAHRPVLATRRLHVLHPRAEDQAGYWAEVLRTFQEVAEVGGEPVPLLLVGSSRSNRLIDLLTTGLAELGLGEVKSAHRSQREHLLRASSNGFALVDLIDHWPIWKSLAESAGIVLQPVVEALPIEEWHACAEVKVASSADAESSSQITGYSEVLAIDGASLLETAPALIEERLYGWLNDVGLSPSQAAVVLIDPRAATAGKGLSHLVDLHLLTELPLPAEQSQRLDLVLSPFKLVREEAPEGLEAMERFLVSNWQPRLGRGGNPVTEFKPSQRIAMEAICTRAANVLVCLPTGEGKSVLFQVPALCRGLRNRRLTLVISPLKALMRDQVERLREQGFSEAADYLSGDRPPHEIGEVIQGLLDHRIVLLYVAPERLRSEVFLDVLYKRMKSDEGLEHVVVDETHCVNQWGYEFRPDYFHALALLLRMCGAMGGAKPTPFLLLSATITASDRLRLKAIMSGESSNWSSPLPLLAKPDTFTNPLRAHIAVQPHRVRGMLHDRKNFGKALAERLPFIEQAMDAARRNRASTGQRSAVIVFVSSRAHAEIVAQRLSRAASVQVDYYHAGLDSATREEIYNRFLDGELDVLVATKAFGMGMDIPDIHWVVHLSPPGYLEDYLQEVGRIGRGAREREKAKLDKLSAMLLFSDLDFETIRTMRARSALSLPVIRDLHSKISEHAREVEGQRIAIVPSEGYRSPQDPEIASAAASRAIATRVRMALYWLERAGRVTLCGSMPDLIELTIHPSALRRISQESGVIGDVAGLILNVESHSAIHADAANGAANVRWKTETCSAKGGLFGEVLGSLGRLIGSLADTVGVMFGGSKQASTSSVPARNLGAVEVSNSGDGSSKTIVLNLSQVRLRSSALKSTADVLGILTDIEKSGGISLNRKVQVVPRKLASEPFEKIRQQFDYVDGAVAELIRRLAIEGRIEFNPFEMVEDVDGPLVDDDKRRIYERSYINGFRSLARDSGIKLRLLVRNDEKVIWEAILPQSARSTANSRRRLARQGAEGLFEAVRGETSVRISTLVEKLRSESRDGRFREADLNKAVGLLSAMSLVSIATDLVPLCHVVALKDDEGVPEDQNNVWDELKQVNELAEARNLAMEVFANMGADAQPAFIEGYFATSNAPSLKQFLDTQLGEILTEGNDGDVSTIIAAMQEKLRATKAVEFFDRFKRSEEPMQWAVARAPFDRHVMVNAGPGAGKTFVLVGRIAHLIREQNIDPSQIVVLAFNRAVVFEIRRRIRELFRSLGYSAYAARLRVHTFHSFAIRSLTRIEGIDVKRSDMDGVLARFANKMAKDPVFSRNVAGSVRSILVDEFQDVTDDVYTVIEHLYLGSDSRSGVMVIGDDDQDILRWQRKKDGSKHEFSESYFDRFERDFGDEKLDRFVLGVNFRSGSSIVERSQSSISTFFERSKRSRRLKQTRLVSREQAEDGSCDRIDWRGRRWDEAIEHAKLTLQEFGERPSESTAVLCRSNAEVAEGHRLLSPVVPNLSVQGVANLRVADLRHVGMWLDHLRGAANRDDRALSNDLKREISEEFSRSTRIPEVLRPETSEVRLNDLWDLCCQEQAFPHISSLTRFVEDLRTDDLGRLTGLVGATSTAIVSTLHRVKGLEFHNVIILPSSLSFGGKAWGSRVADLAGDAAEEARLLYVGMTRAKNRLSYYVGDRERCWLQADPAMYEGQSSDGRVLVGSMEDTSLGWASQQNHFNANPDECQRYIETEVSIGDPITLGGYGAGAFKSFMHCGLSGRSFQVGFLAKQHGSGGPRASLRVSAVVRFRPDQTDETLAESVRTRGWGYAVLVSGRLR